MCAAVGDAPVRQCAPGWRLPPTSPWRVARLVLIGMRVVGIEHVQVAMPPGGEDVARGFYRDLLGLPEVPKPAHLAVRGGCWFEDGDVKVHLGIEPDFRAARKAHPALMVDGLTELTAALVGAGYVVTETDPEDAQNRAYVDDPFGNRIELIELPSG